VDQLGVFFIQQSYSSIFLGVIWWSKKVNLILMVAHTCNPSNLEAEAGNLEFQASLGLHREALSQKKNQKTTTKKTFTVVTSF
jgi:hypothetical protein